MVSVSMIAYNQEHLIAEAIESVINQTYTDWELIVGDDCSTDNTYEVARRYQQRFPEKIILFRNAVNVGITVNSNEVLRRCRGKYIAFTGGDDVFLPEKLSKQVALMEKNPDCVLSYHDVEVFQHDSGEIIHYIYKGKCALKPVVGSANEVSKALVRQGTSFMAAMSVMVRRDAVPKNGYDFRVPVASDWLFWIEVCAGSPNGYVLFLQEVHVRYRKHKDSITLKKHLYFSDNNVTLAIVEAQYPELRNAWRQGKGYCYYSMGVAEIMKGNYTQGREDLLAGARISVYSWKWLGWWLYSWFRQLRAYINLAI